MRLAIIRQRYLHRDGAERFLEGALEALLERNVAITLYTREWPQTKLQLIEPHICDPYYAGRLWRDWGFARAVTRTIGEARANLVQSHERILSCDVYRPGDGLHVSLLEEQLRGAGLLERLQVRLSPWHHYTLHMERALFASPWLRAVLCTSRMVRDDIMRHFGLPEARLPVIYNAIDTDAFSPALREHRERVRSRHRIPEDAVTFMIAGNDFQRKGVDAAMHALAELPVPAHLIVHGDDPRIDFYRTLSRTLDLRQRVTFVAAPMDAAPYYGAADAFVLPAIYEASPDAALEAMAAGLPVVTSTRSGAAELVEEHDAGLVCAARDRPALVAAMRTLLDADARARLGANARRATLPLTPSAMTLKLVLIYKELLEASLAHKASAQLARSAAQTGPVVAEAPPLHGEDGLESETLAPPDAGAAQMPPR